MSVENVKFDSAVRPKVALVLGTGGIKPLAGLSLIEFLQEHKIPIDLLVGCSGGALLSAVIGAGKSVDEIRRDFGEKFSKEVFSKLDYRTILGIISSRLGSFNKTSGILKPERLKKLFYEYFKDLRLEQLKPRTLIQTTDVDTGEGVVLTKGSVADAVYASCAFFPAFPPARIDGRWLGDGIYSAPVPVMEAIKRNMDVIIALDFKEKVTEEPQGFFECFYRHIDNTMRSLTRSQMFMSIELHHHEIVIVEVNFDHTINPWDLDEVPTIIEAGRRAMEEHKDIILSAISSYTRPITTQDMPVVRVQSQKTGPQKPGPEQTGDRTTGSPPPELAPRRTMVLPERKSTKDSS